MPRTETCAMDQRTRFIVDDDVGQLPVRVLCCKYGIRPKTAYKWLHRQVLKRHNLLRPRLRRRRRPPWAQPPGPRREKRQKKTKRALPPGRSEPSSSGSL